MCSSGGYRRQRDIEIGSIRVGEEVWVKPPNARCTSQWGRGRVT